MQRKGNYKRCEKYKEEKIHCDFFFYIRIIKQAKKKRRKKEKVTETPPISKY